MSDYIVIGGSVPLNNKIGGDVKLNNTVSGGVGSFTPVGDNNYENLKNKPSINGVELVGNKTTEDLHIESGVTSVNGKTGEVVLDASDVNALPDNTFIPTNTSDLNNDSGFISTEVDPTVPSWAKQPTKPTYTADEVGALSENTYIPENTSDLNNDSGFMTSIFTDLGEFSMEDYDWDFWEYLSDKTESGFYKIFEVEDGFWYFFRVEASDNTCYQEYWYSEEGGLIRYCRSGSLVDDNEWEWWSESQWLNIDTADGRYAYTNHTHDIEVTINVTNINTYLNSIEHNSQVGLYKIINTRDNSVHYVEFDRRNVNNRTKLYQFWTNSNDDYIRIRFGEYFKNTLTWYNWKEYMSSDVIYDNIYSMDYIDETYYTKEEVDELIEGGGSSGNPNMVEKTWAELVALRDSSKLVKGTWYRITDYNFITTKLGVQSGNHQFDIVLLAISESMLSESGYACKHKGDHYFEREVTEGGIEWLYSLYVDDYAESYGDEAIDHADDIHSMDVFCDSDIRPHPDTGNDVPVLYKTDIEEYSLDDPDYDDAYFYEGTYDLDGDEYDMWAKYEQDPNTGDWVFMQQYALTPIVVEDGELIVSPIPETKIVPVNMNAWELKYCLDNDKELFDWAATGGKGVIYYLKDEFGNEAPYDFKNILFQRTNITGVSSQILSPFRIGEISHTGLSGNYSVECGKDSYFYYTFDTPYNAGNDSSLFGDSAYNVIKPYIIDGQRLLNNMVFGFSNNNYFGNNCYDITIWGTVRNNNFEYECSNLLIYTAAEVYAKSLRNITMYSISTTSFDSGCRQCIGNMVSGFDVGAGSFQLDFGISNMNNQIGRGCQNIKFGTYSYNNEFSNGVANCTLGNYVSHCEFGNAAVDITLPNYVRYCKFEPDIHRIEFTTTGGSTSKYIQYVTVGRGISNLSVAPARGLAYETIYYKTGKVENAV